MPADLTAPKQRGRPFAKGQSGNPKGRPVGARNAATLLAEHLLDNEAEEIIREIIKKAKRGDVTCLRLCLDRLVPPRRDRPVHFTIPVMNSANDASKAMAAITTAVASGELTPIEAAELSNVIEVYVRAIEARDFEARLRALEASHAAEPERTIFLCFGDDYTAVQAKSGQREWNREPDEDHEQFKARIVADLGAAHGTPPFAVMLFNLES